MSDIVERLRASVTQCRALDRSELLNEAAGEIEKLRRRLRLADAALRSDSDTLTDAEREAVERLACACETSAFLRDPVMAATLRGLLERTK